MQIFQEQEDLEDLKFEIEFANERHASLATYQTRYTAAQKKEGWSRLKIQTK